VAYVLVLLERGPNAGDQELHQAAHEDFIDSLIERHAILLGGSFGEDVGEADGAYVLRCVGVEEAGAIAANDPLVVNGVVRARCVEWELVGIDPEAIDGES
jgi:uncharacterized protein YciI